MPPFDEDRILLIMEGHCGLCSAVARRIARWDRMDRVRIAPLGTPLGRSLLGHFGLEPDDPQSWLMIQDGYAYGSIDGMMRLFPQLKWWCAPLKVLVVLPEAWRDWLYARVARNRYRIWGRAELCAMPSAELRRRLVL